MQSVGSCQPSVHKEDALRWEVLCVQGLWGSFSNKSAFMEHPVADSGEASCVQGVLTGIGKRTDRRAPDGSLREELCVCRECGQGSCDQSAFFTHCRENPYVGILWGCSSQLLLIAAEMNSSLDLLSATGSCTSQGMPPGQRLIDTGRQNPSRTLLGQLHRVIPDPKVPMKLNDLKHIAGQLLPLPSPVLIPR